MLNKLTSQREENIHTHTKNKIRPQHLCTLCLTVKKFQTEYTFYFVFEFKLSFLSLGNITAREESFRISGETHRIGKRPRETGERIGIHVRSVKQGKGLR